MTTLRFFTDAAVDEFDRLREAPRDLEEQPLALYPEVPVIGQVEITSLTTTDGYYPVKFIRWNPSTQAWVDRTDTLPAWLLLVEPPAGLAVGDRFPVTSLIGTRPGDGQAIFVDRDQGGAGGGVETDYGARVTGNASAPASTGWLAIPFTTVDFDAGPYHSVVQNTRLTVPTGLGGHHILGGHVEFSANKATGYCGVRIHKLATIPFPPVVIHWTNDPSITYAPEFVISYLDDAAPGDWYELEVFADDGIAVPVSGVFWISRAKN